MGAYSVLAVAGAVVLWDVDDASMARQPDYIGKSVNQREDRPYRLRPVVEAAEQKHSAEARQLELIRIDHSWGLEQPVRSADTCQKDCAAVGTVVRLFFGWDIHYRLLDCMVLEGIAFAEVHKFAGPDCAWIAKAA